MGSGTTMMMPCQKSECLQHLESLDLSTLEPYILKPFVFIYNIFCIAGSVFPAVSGFVLFRTRVQLKSCSGEKSIRQSAASKSKRASRTHSEKDAESAFGGQDPEAIAAMQRLRTYALFGPLVTAIAMTAVPAALVPSSDIDTGLRVLFSLFVISLLHIANMSVLQEYFDLASSYPDLSFGSDICSAREEKMRCEGFDKLYYTLLFASCFVQTGTSEGESSQVDRTACGGRRGHDALLLSIGRHLRYGTGHP